MDTCGDTDNGNTCERRPHDDPYHAQVALAGVVIWPVPDTADRILEAREVVLQELPGRRP